MLAHYSRSRLSTARRQHELALTKALRWLVQFREVNRLHAASAAAIAEVDTAEGVYLSVQAVDDSEQSVQCVFTEQDILVGELIQCDSDETIPCEQPKAPSILIQDFPLIADTDGTLPK